MASRYSLMPCLSLEVENVLMFINFQSCVVISTPRLKIEQNGAHQ